MKPITRRQFSQLAPIVSALTVRGLNERQAIASELQPVYVDTHLHCFAGTSDTRFPYHPQGPYRPDEQATPEHLLQCMGGADVSYAVVVHAEPYQDDHRYLEHCLQVGGSRLKGTCLFFANDPKFPIAMRTLLQRCSGKIVAARIHAYVQDRLPPFGTPELKSLWRTASELGLAMQLHFEPRYAPGFEPLIAEFSNTTVIIDHLGRPFQGTEAEHAVVVRWSRFKNTVMKIASLPKKEQYPHRDIGPVITELVKAFGAERIITGGGFDHVATPESYRAYRERLVGLLANVDESKRAKILGGNAVKLFGFGDL